MEHQIFWSCFEIVEKTEEKITLIIKKKTKKVDINKKKHNFKLFYINCRIYKKLLYLYKRFLILVESNLTKCKQVLFSKAIEIMRKW